MLALFTRLYNDVWSTKHKIPVLCLQILLNIDFYLFIYITDVIMEPVWLKIGISPQSLVKMPPILNAKKTWKGLWHAWECELTVQVSLNYKLCMPCGSQCLSQVLFVTYSV
jgi:hypothetical protein